MLDSVVVRRCHDDDLCSLSNQMCKIRCPGSSSLAFAWPGGVGVRGEGCCRSGGALL